MGLLPFLVAGVGSIGGGIAGGALGAGIATGAGALAGGLASAGAQQETNVTNEAIAQKQMDFQEMMSSTAYQRATTDMKAAGINPMLAVSNGGASTPSGASIGAQNPINAQIGQSTVSTALDAMKTLQDIEKTKSETDVNKQTKLNLAATNPMITANAKQAAAQATTSNVKSSGYQLLEPIISTLKERLGMTQTTGKSFSSSWDSPIPQKDFSLGN